MPTVKELKAQAKALGYDGPFKGLLKADLELLVFDLTTTAPQEQVEEVFDAIEAAYVDDTVRVAEPIIKTRTETTVTAGREFTITSSYAHVSEDDMVRILGERGVTAPDDAKRAELEGLMAASEPGVHVVKRSESY